MKDSVEKIIGRALVPLVVLAFALVWCAACTNPFYPAGGSGSGTWLIGGLLVPGSAGLYKKDGGAWNPAPGFTGSPNTDTYLADVCAHLNAAGSQGEYLMLLGADITSPAVTMSSSVESRKLTIAGVGDTPKTIQLGAWESDSLVTIRSGNTLILHRNVTLRGHSEAQDPLVEVLSGTLVMEEGSVITGHTDDTGFYTGGGVYVDGGTFTMNGGSVTGNTSTSLGGGVRAINSELILSGGTITNNKAVGNDTMGGGVHITGGRITIAGTTITGNEAVLGGGVYLDSGASGEMTSGSIQSNIARAFNSTSKSYGGGVYVKGTFTIAGGSITGNSAIGGLQSYGGGLCVETGGTVLMNNGLISGNTADWGGGILIGPNEGGVFTKQNTGGVIKDNNAGPAQGRQAWLSGSNVGRDTNVDADDVLDSADPNVSGGWEP